MGKKRGAFRVGKMLGIQVRLSPWMLGMLALAAMVGQFGTIGAMMLTVFVHELCHAFAARMLGMCVEEVEMMPFGGVARVSTPMAADPKGEMIVALAGPLANALVVLAIGTLGYYGVRHPLLDGLASCNLLVGSFNLLPALPLDGGRVLRALLSQALGVARATRVAAYLGMALGALLLVLGGILLFAGTINVTFFGVGLLVLLSAWQQRAQAPYMLLRGLEHKKEALRRCRVLPVRTFAVRYDTPVATALQALRGGCLHRVVLVDDALRERVILSEAQLMDGMLRAGAQATLRQIID